MRNLDFSWECGRTLGLAKRGEVMDPTLDPEVCGVLGEAEAQLGSC